MIVGKIEEGKNTSKGNYASQKGKTERQAMGNGNQSYQAKWKVQTQAKATMLAMANWKH